MGGLWLHIRLRVVNGATLVDVALGTLPCDIRCVVNSHLDPVLFETQFVVKINSLLLCFNWNTCGYCRGLIPWGA